MNRHEPGMARIIAFPVKDPRSLPYDQDRDDAFIRTHRNPDARKGFARKAAIGTACLVAAGLAIVGGGEALDRIDGQPECSADTMPYAVMPGDSLSAIASDVNASDRNPENNSDQEIASLITDLNPTVDWQPLRIGEVIVIPREC